MAESESSTGGAFFSQIPIFLTKTTDLMAYIHYLSDRRIGFRNRIDLLLNFRILKVKPLMIPERRLALFTSLQLSYYEKTIRENKFL